MAAMVTHTPGVGKAIEKRCPDLNVLILKALSWAALHGHAISKRFGVVAVVLAAGAALAALIPALRSARIDPVGTLEAD
jgi:ABC-type lipoprotein release transport system permease subunit